MKVARFSLVFTLKHCAVLLLYFPFIPWIVSAQVQQVSIVEDDSGIRLQVDGEDFMVMGMNWDYFPRGTTYNYALWDQPDEIIIPALEREMTMLKDMGVNTIRQYVGVTPRWVEYIYERFGIYTALNHALGRYGVSIDGVYRQSTDYSDPVERAQIMAEVLEMVDEFKDTPGVIMWLLGNENNYGLEWSSAETEALPVGERNTARATHLYSLFGETARAIKEIDTLRPVAMANGDLQYIDIIAEQSMDVDIFGTNTYRGISFEGLYEEVRDKLGKPVVLTEFGADAFDALRMQEDQVTQARYLVQQWKEVYESAAGKGGANNSIGGMTFQWSDGWWKYGQEHNLDIQDSIATWHNDAYPEDYQEGINNMNEEWWGVVAKGPTDANQQFELYPRAAYYVLKIVHSLDPYSPDTDQELIDTHFSSINPTELRVEDPR